MYLLMLITKQFNEAGGVIMRRVVESEQDKTFYNVNAGYNMFSGFALKPTCRVFELKVI